MQKNVRVFIIGAVLITASLFGAYWMQQYLLKSRASAAPPTASFLITGPKVNPGDSFDVTLQINPNLTPFYSFDVAFTYDPLKVDLKVTDPAKLTDNIIPLASTGTGAVDVQLLKGVGTTNVNTASNTIRISGLKVDGSSDPFTGREPLNIVKVSFVMKTGQELPFDFKWVDPDSTKANDSDSYEKKDLHYTGEAEIPSNLVPYACGTEDFSGTSLNTSKWALWTNNGGTIGFVDGIGTLYLLGAKENSNVNITASNEVSGDFIAELLLKSHSTLDSKKASNFGMQFINLDSGKSETLQILRQSNNPEIINSVNYLDSVWAHEGKNINLSPTTPIKVKIERRGSIAKMYYDLLDNKGYILVRQVDNFYTGNGKIQIFLDNWAPDFPQTSGVLDDFKLTCYKQDVSVTPIGVPTTIPPTGVVQPTGAYNSLTPVPTIEGGSGQTGQTTTFTPRADLLYINSIASYQSPFRYEQGVKLEKGSYTLKVGAKIYVRKERGMVIGLVCNQTTCGAKKMGQMIYVSKVFPVKAEFSEMTDTITIPDAADNKAFILRVFCEDGSECELDYITLEDAWGSERLKNNNFEDVQKLTDPRRQPSSWEVDDTANLYGSIDPATGIHGALMINNSAK